MAKQKKSELSSLFADDFFNQYEDAKPFLKWAGGKTQLIPEIINVIPKSLLSNNNITYIEPFVGSGAVLFDFMKRYYSKINRAIINDINPTLVSLYNYIKHDPDCLIKELNIIKTKYLSLNTLDDKEKLYIENREIYNSIDESNLKKACLMLFLNKSCFNGLYRVNKNNKFNVPFGKHSNPSFFDEKVIYADSFLLKKVDILEGDYEETYNHIGENTFFYFDPPYKPISNSSNFNSYSSVKFEDNEQLRLKNFCDKITNSKCFFILSNSDIKNVNPNDDFFDNLYKDYIINRVSAKRAINSVASERGSIFELLITNNKIG